MNDVNNKLLKKGLLLEYITLLWNVIGCGFVIMAGISTHSISLFGFGIDSVIEILASVVVIWQLKSIGGNKERIAERLIGVAFILLSLYIVIQSYFSIMYKVHPSTSVFGMVFIAVTAIVMFSLSYGKSVIGKQLGNKVLQSEAKITLIDGLLATSVLIGLLLNAMLGLWWADIISGFILVWYGLEEVRHIFGGH